MTRYKFLKLLFCIHGIRPWLTFCQCLVCLIVFNEKLLISPACYLCSECHTLSCQHLSDPRKGGGGGREQRKGGYLGTRCWLYHCNRPTIIVNHKHFSSLLWSGNLLKQEFEDSKQMVCEQWMFFNCCFINHSRYCTYWLTGTDHSV